MTASIKRRLFSLSSVVSLAVSIGFLLFLLTRFNIDLKAVWVNLRRTDPVLYIIGILLYYCGFVLRGMRWDALLRNVGAYDKPRSLFKSTTECSHLVLIGWFINAISWFRLGDAYRAYALTQNGNANFSKSVGTVLAERIIDAWAVFILFAIAVSGLALSASGEPWGLLLWVALGLAVASGIILLAMHQFGPKVSRFLPKKLSEGYASFHEGTMGSLHRLPLVLALTIAAWMFEISRLFFVTRALGFDLSLSMILAVGLANSLLAAIPFTPGGIGIVEPGITGLISLKLAREDAISLALGDRSITYLSTIVFGTIAFLLWQTLGTKKANEKMIKRVRP